MSRQRRPSIGRGTSPQRHAERGLAGYEWRASARQVDRKSTRLNSSHLVISYAVFCLKKTLGKECPRGGNCRKGSGCSTGFPAFVVRLICHKGKDPRNSKPTSQRLSFFKEAAKPGIHLISHPYAIRT